MTFFKRMRMTMLAGAGALAIGVAFLGLAFAQGTPVPGQGQGRPERPGMQAFQQALANQLGVTPDRLEQAMQAARAQAGFPTPGPRPQGDAARQRRGPGGDRGSVAAQAMGITPEQLRQELPGKSLAQVAQAHGKNPADVAAALKNAASQRIDERMNHVVPQGGFGRVR
jgi:DNA-binding transcriptional regulator YdaS (Cro superfamily)